MMNSHHKTPRQIVKLVLTDPWDLVTSAGSESRNAFVIKTGQDQNSRPALLLELEKPFTVSGDEYKFLVATARHDDTALRDLRKGTTVGCNLLRLPQSRAESGAPFDTSWWRGGWGAAIGDVTVE
jgi:hypothetical protein